MKDKKAQLEELLNVLNQDVHDTLKHGSKRQIIYAEVFLETTIQRYYKIQKQIEENEKILKQD